jgi:hypothetical protein
LAVLELFEHALLELCYEIGYEGVVTTALKTFADDVDRSEEVAPDKRMSA